MTERTFADRILAPARRARRRLAAGRAWFGARGAAGSAPPEGIGLGEADRGARLVAGVWLAAGREFDLAGGSLWTSAAGGGPRIEVARQDFGWLDDLAALDNRPARALARSLTAEWIDRYGSGAGPGWDSETAGLRAMRWVAHARMLAEGAEPRAAARFWRALAAHQRFLSGAWSGAAPGLPRLRALAGLAWTGIALPSPSARTASARLGGLAGAEVGPEGEIASRRPEELARILALLTWTARLLEDGGKGADPAHLAAIVRLAPTLRPLRMGDGSMARFHGGGGWEAAAIDKALAELRLETQPRPRLPLGYARLTGGRIVIVMDAAAPPPDGFDGPLAFEMSVGRQPLVVSQGPGELFGPAAGLRARAAAAQSTIDLGPGAPAAPTLVSARQAQDASGMWIAATHDGHVASRGLLHERRIFVDVHGREARGEEILTVTDARARAALDRSARGGRLPFAVRFHLHPAVTAAMEGEAALLRLPGGEVWELRAGGGTVAVEDSVYFDAEAAAPTPTRQVVVRAEVVEYLGQVTWSLLRVVEAPRVSAGATRG